jgi:hypothetical protein
LSDSYLVVGDIYSWDEFLFSYEKYIFNYSKLFVHQAIWLNITNLGLV